MKDIRQLMPNILKAASGLMSATKVHEIPKTAEYNVQLLNINPVTIDG